MQSFVQFLLVPDFADVDRIAQDVVEGPAREGRTTTDPTKPIGSLFADDAQRIKPCAQIGVPILARDIPQRSFGSQ